MNLTLLSATMGILVISCTAQAQAAEYDWTGIYETKETNFVTVKRLEITKEKNGSLKVRGTLVGFPEEVSIGEATADPYVNRSTKESTSDTLLVRFPSEKYKPLIVVKPQSYNHGNPADITSVNYTCYFTDVDGRQVHVAGVLPERK